MNINYQYLADAVKHYEALGYRQIEVPWWVTENVKDITKPLGKLVPDYQLSVNKKYLVASGEQSYLYMMAKGMLPSGKYLTITPCFRNETQDVYHRKHFIKCELIHAGSNSEEDLYDMIRAAEQFFSKYTGIKRIPMQPQDIITTMAFDIETEDGIELGSYGIRHHGPLRWVFGTGLAEPRLSMILGNNP
jgi:elongation factor P--beta-lysine ligase